MKNVRLKTYERHRKSRRTLLARKGFTIIEVLFAVTLIGMVIMFLFELYPSSMMAVRRAEHRLKAANIAQSVLEQKRYAAFSDLYSPPQDMGDVTGDDGTVYRKTGYECFNVPDSTPENLKGIRITVTWKERNRDSSIMQEIYVYRIQR